MKHFQVLFEGMLTTKHDNYESVIDYFYEKSKEYETESNNKKNTEDKLRITMFAKHAKDHKKKGDYLGFLGGLQGDEKAGKEGEMREEQKDPNEKDEQALHAPQQARTVPFVQEAWSLLNGLSTEDFEKKTKEEIQKEEIYFLEDYYSYNFRAQNLSSMASKIADLDKKAHDLRDGP